MKKIEKIAYKQVAWGMHWRTLHEEVGEQACKEAGVVTGDNGHESVKLFVLSQDELERLIDRDKATIADVEIMLGGHADEIA